MEDKQARILRAIAVAMKTEAKLNAKLNGRKQYERAGLSLWLQLEAGTWTLAISRQTQIEDEERLRIAAAFKIPENSRHKTTQKESWNRVWYRWSAVKMPGCSCGENYHDEEA